MFLLKGKVINAVFLAHTILILTRCSLFTVCGSTHCVCRFCGVNLGMLLIFAIILLKEGWLVYFNCVVSFCVLCLFPAVSWVDMCSVIVASSGHIHLLVVSLGTTIIFAYC